MQRPTAPVLIVAAHFLALAIFTGAGGIAGFCLFVGLLAPFFDAATLMASRHG